MELDDVFRLVAEKLNKYGVPWWLEYGSLLGCVREGRRIPWDDDYDLGYPVEYAVDVLDALSELPDCLFVNWNLYFGVSYLRGMHRDGIKHYICLAPFDFRVDRVFLPESLFRGLFDPCSSLRNALGFSVNFVVRWLPLWFQRLVVKANMMVHFQRCAVKDRGDYQGFLLRDMGGVPVLIPGGFDRLLRMNFGEDYMTPKQGSGCYLGGRSYEEMVCYLRGESRRLKKRGSG